MHKRFLSLTPNLNSEFNVSSLSVVARHQHRIMVDATALSGEAGLTNAQTVLSRAWRAFISRRNAALATALHHWQRHRSVVSSDVSSRGASNSSLKSAARDSPGDELAVKEVIVVLYNASKDEVRAERRRHSVAPGSAEPPTCVSPNFSFRCTYDPSIIQAVLDNVRQHAQLASGSVRDEFHVEHSRSPVSPRDFVVSCVEGPTYGLPVVLVDMQPEPSLSHASGGALRVQSSVGASIMSSTGGDASSPALFVDPGDSTTTLQMDSSAGNMFNILFDQRSVDGGGDVTESAAGPDALCDFLGKPGWLNTSMNRGPQPSAASSKLTARHFATLSLARAVERLLAPDALYSYWTVALPAYPIARRRLTSAANLAQRSPGFGQKGLESYSMSASSVSTHTPLPAAALSEGVASSAATASSSDGFEKPLVQLVTSISPVGVSPASEPESERVTPPETASCLPPVTSCLHVQAELGGAEEDATLVQQPHNLHDVRQPDEVHREGSAPLPQAHTSPLSKKKSKPVPLQPQLGLSLRERQEYGKAIMCEYSKRHSQIKPFSPSGALMDAEPRRGSPGKLAQRDSIMAAESNSRPVSPLEGARALTRGSSASQMATALRERIREQRLAMGADTTLSRMVDQLAHLRAQSRQKTQRQRAGRSSAFATSMDATEDTDQLAPRPGSAMSNSEIILNPTSTPQRVVTRALTPHQLRQIAHSSMQSLVPPLLRPRRIVEKACSGNDGLPLESSLLGSSATAACAPKRKLKISLLQPVDMWKAKQSSSTRKEASAIEPSVSVASRIQASRQLRMQRDRKQSDRGPGHRNCVYDCFEEDALQRSPSRALATAAQSVNLFRIPTGASDGATLASADDIAYLKQLHATVF